MKGGGAAAPRSCRAPRVLRSHVSGNKALACVCAALRPPPGPRPGPGLGRKGGVLFRPHLFNVLFVGARRGWEGGVRAAGPRRRRRRWRRRRRAVCGRGRGRGPGRAAPCRAPLAALPRPRAGPGAGRGRGRACRRRPGAAERRVS